MLVVLVVAVAPWLVGNLVQYGHTLMRAYWRRQIAERWPE